MYLSLAHSASSALYMSAAADSVTNGQAIVDAALAAYGRLDIVINNAGILTPEAWNDLTVGSWQRTLDINLTGVFSVRRDRLLLPDIGVSVQTTH